ncbi:hypothetical protein [Roseibium marinum]|uniref:Uncharacterized protein n=1 Tax=Roseibium marinum TaxID=281252 RepID=A0A2S3UMA4_9HYPH|nr:hypothetical protein [Roseibium marinum]POF28619.1 hypothetical protein CLV41_11232 [Roseibium marinum]
MFLKKILPALALSMLAGACQTGADVPTDLGGNTILFYNQAHGVQVEYFSKSGRTSLWYPGNTGSLPGRWTTKMDGNLICFGYPKNSYNPVTKELGGGLKCRLTADFKRNVRQTCKGDVFNLASGKIPFVLTKSRSQISTLKKSCS